MLVPLIDTVGRPLGGFHVPGGAPYLQQLTLWLAFLGGLLAARESGHLTLSTAELLGEGRGRRLAVLFAASVAAAVLGVLAYGAWQVVRADREQGKVLPGGLPEWVSECVMPAALALIALRLVWRAGDRWLPRAVALACGGRRLRARPWPEPTPRRSPGRSPSWSSPRRSSARRSSPPWAAWRWSSSSRTRCRSRRCRRRSIASSPRRPCRRSRC